MRVGEVLALTLDDFDLKNMTVKINKTYVRLRREDHILEPKTHKSNRTITLNKFLIDELREYLTKLYDYEPHQRLFVITHDGIRHEFVRGINKSGVKRIRIHDLRHSHASLLIEMGFTPLLIAERLGHENINTTLETYSHLYPNKHSEVAEKLQELKLNSTNEKL
jgi:integrase